jgi:hypothetical protein
LRYGYLTIKNFSVGRILRLLDIGYVAVGLTLSDADRRLNLTGFSGRKNTYNFISRGDVLHDIRNVLTRLAVGNGDVKITDLGH